jgi:hypothetical protein
MLWECGTLGRQPYEGMSFGEMRLHTVRDKRRLPPPLHCSVQLYALMEACWAEAPQERPSFGEVLQRLAVLPADLSAGPRMLTVPAWPSERAGIRLDADGYVTDASMASLGDGEMARGTGDGRGATVEDGAAGTTEGRVVGLPPSEAPPARPTQRRRPPSGGHLEHAYVALWDGSVSSAKAETES